ncbi:polyamine aminopropyltransferase [uncultured Aquimarina sp.]|uniref:hypothetical protein n=1 Tax=uncultured Aquimarina sp. TaxID=575652 RepID=UPI0026185CF8|nr:hypothetical protein [uncultured Aquimarina sp.]
MIKYLASKFLDQSKKADEIIWAHVYHDSIRGRTYLENLNLNIGRWAGNYAFFYILNRILHDFKPKSILELGLGESSKFIMTCLTNFLNDTKHTVIEHDPNWIALFKENNNIPINTSFMQLDLVEKKFNGHTTNVYQNFLEETREQSFDLIIIDGPFGSKRYSRNNILSLVHNLNDKKEFIIIFDDTNRLGEKETFTLLISKLKEKGISLYTQEYKGSKSVSIIATKFYKYATSL